jgi:NADH-quinone oxidoreductase subunit E
MSESGAQPSEPVRFDETTEKHFLDLLDHYPNRQAALLPALHLAQRQFGYLSKDVMDYVSQRLELPPSQVFSVATFYTMFNRHPVGRHHITVCTSPPCAILGADKVVRHLEQRLGIRVGQTTRDRRFTLSKTECMASCGTGPMLDCNGHYCENLTIEKLNQLIEEWSKD